jgi:hypothetical protein
MGHIATLALGLIPMVTPATSSERAPFLVCELAVDGDQLTVTLQNPATRPLAADVLVELVLVPQQSPNGLPLTPQVPYEKPAPDPVLESNLTYRTSLDLSTPVARAAQSTTHLLIEPGQVRQWIVPRADVRWHSKFFATSSGDGPLERIVPAGRYTLRAEVSYRGRIPWRSRDFHAIVRAGKLLVSEDER